jgi:hypothetical protein
LSNKQEKIENESVRPTSDTSDTSDSNALQPIVPVEDFFHDGPDLPWQPLPSHTLEQSPCKPIIVKKGKFYYCKLHPKEIKNIYLDTIEQHCKYQDPNLHKAEILRLLMSESATIIKTRNNSGYC